MSTSINYKKEIIDLTENLSNDKIKELMDFAWFLKFKEEGFSYANIEDSAEYIRKIRIKESEKNKSGQKYIEELIQWQKTNC